MKEELVRIFAAHPGTALLLSIAFSILVAVVGVLPSVFITAANILFFGFWNGVVISFLGEALGAVISFYLYRLGFKNTLARSVQQHKKLERLVNARGPEAFVLIVSLRLLPFVPSGLVTLAAAVGMVDGLTFVIASSLGKIPALLLESYSVYAVIEFGWQGRLLLCIISVGLLFYVVRKLVKSSA